MPALTLNYDLPADHLDNISQTAALELALGCSLPPSLEAWPQALAYEWNTAAEMGLFQDCATIGDLARAWMHYRLAAMDRVRKAA